MPASPVSCNGCISFFSFWKVFHCKNFMMLSFTFNGEREKGYIFGNFEIMNYQKIKVCVLVTQY